MKGSFMMLKDKVVGLGEDHSSADDEDGGDDKN